MRRDSIVLLLLLFCGLAAFGPSLSNPFVFDDTAFIERNLWLKWEHLSGFFRSFILDSGWSFVGFRPLLMTSFVVQKELAGVDPFAYRLANLLLHVGVTFLAFKLLVRLFPSSSNRFWPVVISLLFLLHPVQTNVITLVWKRSDLLVALGMLGSFYAYGKWTEIASGGWRWLILGHLSALFAFLSKESSLVLPLLIGIGQVLIWTRLRPKKQILVFLYLPLLFWAASLAWIIFHVQPQKLAEIGFASHSYMPPSTQFGRWDYFWFQPIALLEYLKLAFWPVHLHVFHHIPAASSWLDSRFWTGVGTVLVGLLAAIRCWRSHPLISFGIAWFFLHLAPASSFVPLQMPFDEDRLYLPLFGLLLVGIELVRLGITQAALSPRLLSFLKQAPLLLILIYGTGSAFRALVWKNPLTLWSINAAEEPRDPRPWIPLGQVLISEGRNDLALAALERAIRLEPEFGVAHHFKGITLTHQNRLDAANIAFQTSLRLNAFPSQNLRHLGVLEVMKENEADALHYFTLSLQRNPRNQTTWRNLARLFQDRGEDDRALRALEQAVGIDSRDPETLARLADLTWEINNDLKTTRRLIRRAIEYDPRTERRRRLRQTLSDLKPPKEEGR